MNKNWPVSFKAMLKHEGGYSNHPRDPGGMTNLGVTKRVWDAYTGTSADEKTMRSLTPEMVEPLYKKNYWDAVCADQLPSGVDFSVFDFCVNSGPGRATRTLQTVVGAKPDGDIGPKTLAAVEKYVDDMGATILIEEYNDARLTFLKSLSTWGTFGKGWERRVNETRELSISMKD